MSVKKIKAFVALHKGISALVALAVLSALYGSFKAKGASAETTYTLGTVVRGSIVTSVSGTGQVMAAQQLDVKAKASGDVLSVKVKAGDTVTAGQTLVSLDATDAANALKSAEISYQKLTEPADQPTLIAAQQALSDAQSAQTRSYTTAAADLASAFSDLSTVTDNMNNFFYSTSGYLNDQTTSSLGTTAESYRSTAGREFDTANREYQTSLAAYKNLTMSSDPVATQAVMTSTLTSLSDLLQSLKDAMATVEYIKNLSANQFNARDSAAAATAAESSVTSWTTMVSGDYNSLTTDQTNITNAPANVTRAKASLDKVVQGADPLDVESEQLSLSLKQQAYDDAFVIAPFSGIVGKVDVNLGDSVSTGSTVATVISQNDIATISLNEVDAAKVKAGDKATLTFDAVPDLSISGTVSEIDLIGTVTQGVVNYAAKITFDTNDSRVNPGMSVSSEIITSTVSDVLVVPGSAVKTVGGQSVVQVFTPALAGNTTGATSAVPPTSVPVVTGASDDTKTEIVSGLTEGEQIVTKTTLGTAVKAATAPTAASILGGGGGARPAGAGAARRIGG